MAINGVLTLALFLTSVFLSSCMSPYRLYSHGNPGRAFESDGSEVQFGAQKFDTLTPTLRWDAFTRFALQIEPSQIEVKNLRYHLVVYKVSTLADYRFGRYLRPDPDKQSTAPTEYLFVPEPGLWYIEEKELTGNQYTFSQPLDHNAIYVWTVSAEYEYAGRQVQNENWLRLNDLKDNHFLYSFTTPGMP